MLRPLARMLLQAVFRFQSRLLAAAQAVWKQLPAPGLGESGVATLQLILLSTLGGTTLLATAVLTETEDVLDQFADIVSAGVERVSGNLEVRGSIIATAPDNEIDTIQFQLGLFGHGSVLLDSAALDQERLTITYRDASGFAPLLPYEVTFLVGDGDNLLEPGELVLITLHASDIRTVAPEAELSANSRFTLELLPSVGGIVQRGRTLPPILQSVMSLH